MLDKLNSMLFFAAYHSGS